MTKSDTKISGLLLLLTFVIAITGAALSLSLHWMVDSSFMPWTNYISDLSVGPNGSSIIYVIMMLGMSFLLIPFFFFLTRELKTHYNLQNPGYIALFFGLITSVDIIIMVFFPLDITRPAIYNTHIITGVILFFGMTGFLGTYGWIFNKLSDFPNILSLLAYGASMFSFIFAVLLAITELFDVLNQHAITYIIEWTAFIFFVVWLLLTSIHLNKLSKNNN